ncbi:C-type lectin domain family 4 member F [Alligator mississippiensis]|uniref:C-type lectin domain family 4 member F n=1 Tax=Alligator mississippiensis TaxID=8496 RepID=UPI002877F4A1|nr:C-type lectin domain family 4 member F [Alligator mississippiensis]
MKAIAEESVYENVVISDVPHQSCKKGNLPESSPKRSHVLCALLLLLSLLLAASLGGVTATYFQEQQEKHRVAEAVQGVRDFWKENSTVNVSVLEQTGQQLVGEIHPLRGLWEEIVSPCAVLQEQYRYLLTRVSQGWRLHGGNLYYFSKEKRSWEEAEQFCVSQNSHLSSVLSWEEQEYLAAEVRNADHWIGLSDREAEGSWRWVDGSEYTKGFWYKKQPDNWNQGIGGTEDCVHLQNGVHHKTWNDVNCTLQHQWVCKVTLGQA